MVRVTERGDPGSEAVLQVPPLAPWTAPLPPFYLLAVGTGVWKGDP